MQIYVPDLSASYKSSEEPFYPYTPAEVREYFPKLKEHKYYVNGDESFDGVKSAVRLIKETLTSLGTWWPGEPSSAEVVSWIQGTGVPLRFAFVVAHPLKRDRYIAAECGPRELTVTVLTAMCEFFSPSEDATTRGTLSAQVTRLNRAIGASALAQDWSRTQLFMREMNAIIPDLASSNEPMRIKYLVDLLADSAGTSGKNDFSEAKELFNSAKLALSLGNVR